MRSLSSHRIRLPRHTYESQLGGESFDLIHGRRKCSGLVLLLLAWRMGAAEIPEAQLPCPGAAAWREAHRDQLPAALAQRDRTRTFGAADLRAELQRRFDADQQERRRLIANPKDREAGGLVSKIDADNLRWLKKLVKENGIPTVAQVGESGVLWTWLLVQHADDDPQFQMSVQPIFVQRQEAGELPAEQMAKLTDRVLLAAGKPQRFGTQFDWYSSQFKLRGTVKIADIEANRQALGLMPLSDYACMMNGRLSRE
jgi:hypothetical protein